MDIDLPSRWAGQLPRGAVVIPQRRTQSNTILSRYGTPRCWWYRRRSTSSSSGLSPDRAWHAAAAQRRTGRPFCSISYGSRLSRSAMRTVPYIRAPEPIEVSPLIHSQQTSPQRALLPVAATPDDLHGQPGEISAPAPSVQQTELNAGRAVRRRKALEAPGVAPASQCWRQGHGCSPGAPTT